MVDFPAMLALLHTWRAPVCTREKQDASYSQVAMALKSRKQPELLGKTLSGVLDSLDTQGQFALFRLVRVWPQVVGDTIARHTEVASLKFHTAVIKVSNAMWIQELNLMRRQILSRLVEAVGDDAIRDLRFVKGTLSRQSRPRPAPARRHVRHSIALPEIKDPQLRQAFEDLIEAWGRAPR
jgi:predicted nucleic acid-binding Zn ribbon protein